MPQIQECIFFTMKSERNCIEKNKCYELSLEESEKQDGGSFSKKSSVKQKIFCQRWKCMCEAQHQWQRHETG